MLPSAITSAPKLTAASTTRSPPRAYSRWPERSGLSTTIVGTAVAVGRLGGASVSRTVSSAAAAAERSAVRAVWAVWAVWAGWAGSSGSAAAGGMAGGAAGTVAAATAAFGAASGASASPAARALAICAALPPWAAIGTRPWRRRCGSRPARCTASSASRSGARSITTGSLSNSPGLSPNRASSAATSAARSAVCRRRAVSVQAVLLRSKAGLAAGAEGMGTGMKKPG